MNVVVFLGPTLPVAEARRILPADYRPPAGRGDVWRAMLERPRTIVLLDGVFERQPSVWHRELLAALSAGITVFGGASLGALRALELAPYGMVGVGEIFRRYRDGELIDDSEVALLHASAEHAFRPLTLPLVNVRHAAEQAREAKVLSRAEAAVLVQAAEEIFYQERHWPKVLNEVKPRWRKATAERWRSWARDGLEDLKAKDARACLAVAREHLYSQAPAFIAPRVWPSAAARELKRRERGAIDPLDARTRLLAAWARTLGLEASARERAQAADAWFAAERVKRSGRTEHLRRCGLDALDALRLFEELALEAKLLANAASLVPDGAS